MRYPCSELSVDGGNDVKRYERGKRERGQVLDVEQEIRKVRETIRNVHGEIGDACSGPRVHFVSEWGDLVKKWVPMGVERSIMKGFGSKEGYRGDIGVPYAGMVRKG